MGMSISGGTGQCTLEKRALLSIHGIELKRHGKVVSSYKISVSIFLRFFSHEVLFPYYNRSCVQFG